jgi:hypothetical protein
MSGITSRSSAISGIVARESTVLTETNFDAEVESEPNFSANMQVADATGVEAHTRITVKPVGS